MYYCIELKYNFFFYLGVFAFDGLLYVIGGYDAESVRTYPKVDPYLVNSVDKSNMLNSVEIYNPFTNTWSIENMNFRMTEIFGVLIVDKTLVTKCLSFVKRLGFKRFNRY